MTTPTHSPTNIAAITFLVVAIIHWIKQQDPEFEAFALGLLDTALGRRLVGIGRPIGIDHEFRERVVHLLCVTPDSAPLSTPTEPRKLTLRRRFLEWLQTG